MNASPGMSGALADLDENDLGRIASRLTESGEVVAGPLTPTVIAGGRSNLTVLLDDGSRSWVLRMPPRRGRTPSAHDVSREFRVASGLAGTAVPVPRAVLYCDSDELIGAPFAVMGFAPGRAVQTGDDLDALSDGKIAEVTGALLDVLSSLHNVDYDEAGLASFGRPDDYAARQLKRWAGQWDLVGVPEVAGLASTVVGLLGQKLPRQAKSTIVHGDFRIDNTLLLGLESDESVEVTAVVDWELSTLGDPVADVAMMCAYRDPAFDLVLGTPTAWASSRLPTPERLAERYEAAGGASLVDWERHLGLACFKIAVIAAGIAHRFRAGATTDVRNSRAGDAVEPYLEAALRNLRG